MRSKQRLFILREVCIETAFKISPEVGREVEGSLRDVSDLKKLILWEEGMINFIEENRYLVGPSQVLSQEVAKILVSLIR